MRPLLVILALLLLFSPFSVQAIDIAPFYSQNQSPLVQIFGLPATDDALLVSKGRLRGFMVVDIASNFGVDERPGESIVLDGESYRATVGLRYGMTNGIEAGIDMPYVFYSGGFLDDLVQGFHSTFGFSQGGRDEAPKNRLLMRYNRTGTRLNIDHSNSGIGDLRLLGGLQLYKGQNDHPAVAALRASVKLPTGDSDQLHGSGSTDFALWISASDDYRLGSGHMTLFGGAGALIMTDGDVLPQQQRNVVAFGTAGLGWAPLQWLALKTQLDLHTPFYQDSDLPELNKLSGNLLFGVAFALPGGILLDCAAGEDLITTTSSPDLTLHFALRKKF